MLQPAPAEASNSPNPLRSVERKSDVSCPRYPVIAEQPTLVFSALACVGKSWAFNAHGEKFEAAIGKRSASVPLFWFDRSCSQPITSLALR